MHDTTTRRNGGSVMLAVAGLACATAVAAVALAVASPRSAGRDGAAADQVASLQQRVVDLERQLERTREAVEAARAERAAPRTADAAPAAAPSADLLERLAAAERRLDLCFEGAESRVATDIADRDDSGRRLLEGMRASRTETTADLQRRAVDASLPPVERVEAVSALRGVPGARDGLVADAMLDVLTRAEDPEVRAAVFRHMKDVTHAGLRAEALRRLRDDADPRVRSEAAEFLGPLRAEPEVREALGTAAEKDPDREVREDAVKALEPRKKD